MSSSISLWTTRTPAADNNWRDVTYGYDLSGNGLFVAVSSTGSGNRVMTSPDGITWTIRSTLPYNNNWYGVTYGKGLFVAVAGSGSGNRVMTSPDGITWTYRTSPVDNFWYGVTYGFDQSGNGLFVAVSNTGTNNRVMTSPNGIDWTLRTSAADNSWYRVTYGNGLFVSVSIDGSGNRVMTSPDGITWTSRTTPNNNNWFAVTYGNGLFVALSQSGTGNRVMTSPDGITWTSRTSVADNQWSGVVYANGLFVAVSGSGSGNRVMTSPDGITWTSGTSPLDNGWWNVTYGNRLFVAVAAAGTGNRVMTATTLQPTLSNFSVPTKTFGNAPFTLTDPSSNSTGAFSYTSSNTSVATISVTSSGNTVTIVGAGTSVITARQVATANYTSGDISANFIVNQATPTLSNFSVPTKTFGDAPFALTNPSSNSTGAFTYTSSNLSVATISGNIVTIVGGGTSIITATQAATANYTSGDISANFIVNQATPTISNFSVPTKTFGNAPFTLTDPSSNSTGAFTYTSSNTFVATISVTSSGNTVTIVGAGTSIITATQAATANYTSGDISANFVVNQADPTLSNFTIPTKTFGDSSFNIINPSSNSSGAFSYSSSDTSVADISGNTVTIVGGGTSIITATQAATANYTSGDISANFVVNQADPTLSNFTIPTKTFGDSSFNIEDPSSNSSGAFSYSSSDTSVADISGNTVTIVGAGNSTITAIQAATTDYLSDSITVGLVVNKAQPLLSNFYIPNKTFGDAPFVLTDPISNSSGTFSYSSSNTSVADISGNIVTILSAGTTLITATQADTNNYLSNTISTTLTTNPNDPNISNFNLPNSTYGDSPITITPPSSNSTGAFTYTSSNLSVADISGNIVTIVGAGSSIITATQAATINFNSGSIISNFTVSPANSLLSNFSIPAKIFGDSPFYIIAPNSNSDGSFNYISSNPSVATILGNTVTIVGVGYSIITATQAATANYISENISANFIVNQSTPTITNFSVPTKTFGDAPFTLTDPSSNSTGAFTYTSSNTSVATISGITVTIISAGTSIITATQAATANYTSGDISANFIINQSTPDNPTIIDNENELLYFMNSNATYGNIDTSFSINYDLIASSYKVLFTNNNDGINITKTI